MQYSYITRIHRCAALFALLLGVTNDANAIDFTVGPKEAVYSHTELKSHGLKMWPEGNIGVLRNSQGAYEFYAPNGSKTVKTTGTLADPGQSKMSVSISNLPKKAFDTVSGGPIFEDAASGARLLLYHAEKQGKKGLDTRSALGIAISTDAKGLKFRDLGAIIEPNRPNGMSELSGGSLAIVDDYLHVYYRDALPGGATSEFAVARAPLAELVSNALNGLGTAFAKYHSGSWSQPGLGGLSSPLEAGNPASSWQTVSRNDYLNQLVMVTSQPAAGGGDLYLSTSSDGINWSPRQPVVLEVGEQFYPTIIGTGPDPTRTSQSFFVYYAESMQGSDNRWKDAQLVRREIILDGPASAAGSIINGPTNGESGLSAAWVSVAGFQSDFQVGTPADGWTYAWNPTGTLGNHYGFTKLKWSEEAQLYNSTGGATRAPIKKKTHVDDHLVLHADGGHPGKPNYMPIVGYTVQSEDGEGLYRLVDSSIAKSDGIKSKKEDGLGVLVYVNDMLLGPAEDVLTNGSLTAFDRDLGHLQVGDTVWVMVDPLKSQAYDGFREFDFTIEKLSALAVVIPEPSTMGLLLAALIAGSLAQRQRSRKPVQ